MVKSEYLPSPPKKTNARSSHGGESATFVLYELVDVEIRPLELRVAAPVAAKVAASQQLTTHQVATVGTPVSRPFQITGYKNRKKREK
jgi:hypothetical protein